MSNVKIDPTLVLSYGFTPIYDEESGLSIFKVQSDSNIISTGNCNCNGNDMLPMSYKGMIIDQDHNVIAPGVPIPINHESLTHDQVLSYLYNPLTKVYPAIDGVLLRFYHYNGKLMISTSGMINPIKGWGPKPARSFIDMYHDMADQVDTNQLDPTLYYYAIMVHPDHCSFTKSKVHKLVLVDILNRQGYSIVSPTSVAFKYVNHQSPQSREQIENWLFSPSTDSNPVNPDMFGVTLVLENGQQLRLTDQNCQKACSLLPNHPDPKYHWLYNLVKPPSALRNTIDTLDDLFDNIVDEEIDKYLVYFPWNKDFFLETKKQFYQLVEDIYNDCSSYYNTGTMPYIKGKQLKLTQEIMDIFNLNDLSYVDIAYILLHQDIARLYYVMNDNYHDVPKRIIIKYTS